ncbi:MAG: amino acid ABC transporter substrate-binding protein [Alphaproteobacteria bacterium HGW-Alphaproteobacteria-2]|nr:MAG: amino acid ABC transporter substrate-binding protein [Alphaproteobacteria bacterium HGW-Alphaproteobacteria-2]
MTGRKYTLTRRHLLHRGTAAATLALAAPWVRPAHAAEPIRIGIVIPFTGASGVYGSEMEQAARLVARRINEAGGLLGGRSLELIIEDSESQPTSGVVATRKLLEVNRVEAIIGYWGSPIAMASKQLLIDAGKVMMVSCAANAVTEDPHDGLIWRFQAKSTQWGPVGARIMLNKGERRVAVLAQQNPFVISMVEPFRAEIERQGGEVIREVIYNPDQPSYRAEVEEIFGTDPDGVFIPGLLTDFTSIVKEYYRAGFDTPITSLSIAADANGKFIENVGAELAEGIHHFQPAPPLDSPNYKRFVREMGAPEDTIFLFAGNAYDQLSVAALAIEKAGTTEARQWTRVIPAVSNPPGTRVLDPVEALELVRRGEEIDFIGAGSDCDFNDIGDQLNRHFLHRVIRDGRNEKVQVIA